MSIVSHHRSSRSCGVSLLAAALLAVPFTAHATEGALGRQVTGTSVQPNAGIVSPSPSGR